MGSSFPAPHPPLINAYVENIQGLPVISGTHPAKIHDFFETLLYNVQSLETLGKSSDCKALVRGVLNKLPGIKAELVQGKPDWKTWDFTQLINALREWKEIHPREIAKSRDRSFYVEDQDPNAPLRSVFCNNTSHKPIDCRNFYKRRGFVLIALALIEQLAVEAEETALAVSKGITHLSANSLPDLQTKELQ